ncbi:MAG: sigma 54-interacting transcriptional regulator [Bacteroidota bacterium]
MSTHPAPLRHLRDLTREQFESLLEISRLLNSAARQEALLEQALDWMLGVVNAERGVVVRQAGPDETPELVAARNIRRESIRDLSEFSSGVLQQVVQKRSPVLYHDAQTDPSVSQFTSIRIRKIKSVVGVPVFRGETFWGALLADSQTDRREFTDANLVFLSFFSGLLSLALDRTARLESLQDENLRLANRIQAAGSIPSMVGESPKMRDLARLVHRVARTDATVLLLGESGTGKDLAAQAIHKLSPRAGRPYLAQFCGSIPDSLLESELFGYRRGAFTGAVGDKKGLLEVAEGGTFLLDEIADISSALQAKLLRVLENRVIIRLGDTEPRAINVRIIAATNKNLETLAGEGGFRPDLFYRLNVFPITLPPLRERREDIGLLARHFIGKISSSQARISPGALRKLEAHSWPGNVRQLMNVLQRALILCEGGAVEEEHVILGEEPGGGRFTGTLREYQQLLLAERLREFNGNRTLAARSLGVSVRWVQMKLKGRES